MSDVIDFIKQDKQFYFPKTEPEITHIPKMNFIMVDGRGAPDPHSGSESDVSEFQRAVGALYGIAYSVKMSYKKGDEPKGYQNFKVAPLEGLWWMEDDTNFDMKRPKDWRWTVMIRMPDFVTSDIVARYAKELNDKKKTDAYSTVRLEQYEEGDVVQLMHIGSYDSEGQNIIKMHEYAKDRGYALRGKHHELYYGDPRRTAPERLKTVLRQPIKK